MIWAVVATAHSPTLINSRAWFPNSKVVVCEMLPVERAIYETVANDSLMALSHHSCVPEMRGQR